MGRSPWATDGAREDSAGFSPLSLWKQLKSPPSRSALVRDRALPKAWDLVFLGVCPRARVRIPVLALALRGCMRESLHDAGEAASRLISSSAERS